jgi:hypothetical protein
MEKQTKILIGIGAAIALYLILKPKKVVVTPNKIPNDFPDMSKLPIPTKEDVISCEDFNCPKLVMAKQGTIIRVQPNTNSKIVETLDEGVMIYPDKSVTMSDGIWYHTSEEGGWVRYDVVTKQDYLDMMYTSNSGSKISNF